MAWWAKQQLKSKNPRTRRQAVERLALTSSPEVLDLFLQAAQDPDEGVRTAALNGLGHLRAWASISRIVSALRDISAEVRQSAVRALANIGDRTCIDVLVSALKDVSPAVRRQAALALDALKWRPTDPRDIALHRVASGRYREAAEIGLIALEPLLDSLKECPRSECRDILAALAQLKDVAAMDALAHIVRDPNSEVRVTAIEALGASRDPRARVVLETALKDPTPAIQLAAAKALEEISDESGLDRLRRSLQNSEPDARLAALQCLEVFPREPKWIELVTGLLSDPDWRIRKAAVDLLGGNRCRGSLRELVLALTDPQPEVRDAGAAALQQLEPRWEKSDAARRAIPAIKARMRSEDYGARQAAANVLSRIGLHRASDPDLHSFTEPVVYKRLAALHALIQLLSDRDPDLRLAGAEGLARLGDVSAIPALAERENDPDSWVRRAVARARALLSSQNQSPQNKSISA